MRIRIHGKVYEAAAVDRVSLRDILTVRSETYGLLGDEKDGVPQGLTWSYVQDVSAIGSSLTEEELINHDIFPIYIALLVWASKCNSGEKTSFFDAQDYTMNDLEFIADPQDHKPGKESSRSARKGSAPAAKRQASAAGSKRTSSTP